MGNESFIPSSTISSDSVRLCLRRFLGLVVFPVSWPQSSKGDHRRLPKKRGVHFCHVALWRFERPCRRFRPRRQRQQPSLSNCYSSFEQPLARAGEREIHRRLNGAVFHRRTARKPSFDRSTGFHSRGFYAGRVEFIFPRLRSGTNVRHYGYAGASVFCRGSGQ